MVTIILSVCLFLAVCFGVYMSYKYYKTVRSNEIDGLYTHVDNVKRSLEEDVNSLTRDTDRRFDEIWDKI